MGIRSVPERGRTPPVADGSESRLTRNVRARSAPRGGHRGMDPNPRTHPVTPPHGSHRQANAARSTRDRSARGNVRQRVRHHREPRRTGRNNFPPRNRHLLRRTRPALSQSRRLQNWKPDHPRPRIRRLRMLSLRKISPRHSHRCRAHVPYPRRPQPRTRRRRSRYSDQPPPKAMVAEDRALRNRHDVHPNPDLRQRKLPPMANAARSNHEGKPAARRALRSRAP